MVYKLKFTTQNYNKIANTLKTYSFVGGSIKERRSRLLLTCTVKNKISKIGDSCLVKLYTCEEYVVQLNSTTIVTYGKTPSRK